MSRDDIRIFWHKLSQQALEEESSYVVGTDYPGDIEWPKVIPLVIVKLSLGYDYSAFSAMEACVLRARYRLAVEVASMMGRMEVCAPEAGVVHLELRRMILEGFSEELEIMMIESIMNEDLEID